MEAQNFVPNDESSDYGSDFDSGEEEIVNELLRNAGNAVPPVMITITKDHERSKGTYAWHPHGFLRLSSVPTDTWPRREAVACSGEADGITSIWESVQAAKSRVSKATSAFVEPMSEFRVSEQADGQPDIRTPLQRFRSKPKKTLSVTDLVSPSWCELQYWYTLTKHGKKRQTFAMKQGSTVHKALEDQVHCTVEVDVRRKEDAWGLRLWNIIQGLRGLRETGLTRELEVWGILDGEVINGIIDEISFQCPDDEMEIKVAAQEAVKRYQPVEGQPSLDSYLRQGGIRGAKEGSKFAIARPNGDRKVYLTDIKTRGLKSLPSGASFRPTAMQLMLYHILLSDLATDSINADIIFDRHNLNPDQEFSSAFVSSILDLGELARDDLSKPAESGQWTSTQDSSSVVLNNRTLRQLWALMIQEFQKTLPHGAKSIGQVLRVEYRGQLDGAIWGEKTFLFDREAISQYLQDEMKWWKGERAAQGVCIEEAYKCRTCEFADDCEWRKKKVDEATEAYRKRSQSAI